MGSRPAPVRGGRAADVAAALILAIGTWLGFAGSGLPRVVPATAPPTTFSAARAMTDLRVIAAAPHAVGTAAHDRVRDFLVDRLRALSCADVHVQSATGFNTLDGPIAATIANVVGRIRGTHPGPAILLTAHYDAVPRGPGAGDDGASVAAILEVVRVLASGPPPGHDVIVVISDAEEEGLLGAEAFVDLHPWAKDVGLVLNFDNRGDAGPVFMFQTSPGNAPLIAALARGVPDARTNSLTGEVYRHLPSDTDLSIWLHSAFPVGALNFGAVGGFTHYHTPIDDIASLDPRIVQQDGDYALGVVRAVGPVDGAVLRTTDAIYASVPLVGVVRYPASWAIPVAIAAFVAVLAVIALARTSRLASWGGIGRGLGIVVLALVIPAVVTAAGWFVIRRLHPAYADILQGDPYNSAWYLLACAGATIAIVIALGRRLAARLAPFDLPAAALLAWAAAGVAVALTLPGASYLLAFPLIALAIGAAWWLVRDSGSRPMRVSFAIAAIPVLVTWPPLIKALEVALTANLLGFCAILIALVAIVALLPVSLHGAFGRNVVILGLVVTAGALVAAEMSAGFTATRKHPDSLLYLVDADSGKAWWATFDRAADPWTAAALGTHPARQDFASWRLTRPGESLLAAGAPPPQTTVSPLEVIATDSAAGGRRIHLRIVQSGAGEMAALYLESPGQVSDVTLNGRALANSDGDRYHPGYRLGSDGTVLRYFGVPPDGVDLWFTVSGAGPVTLRVRTETDGLPATAAGPLPARPRTMMSMPFVPTDVTIIQRTVTL